MTSASVAATSRASSSSTTSSSSRPSTSTSSPPCAWRTSWCPEVSLPRGGGGRGSGHPPAGVTPLPWPPGSGNAVAIDLIVQHVHSQLEEVSERPRPPRARPCGPHVLPVPSPPLPLRTGLGCPRCSRPERCLPPCGVGFGASPLSGAPSGGPDLGPRVSWARGLRGCLPVLSWPPGPCGCQSRRAVPPGGCDSSAPGGVAGRGARQQPPRCPAASRGGLPSVTSLPVPLSPVVLPQRELSVR